MIRRPPRSTQSRSSAASDVYKRQTSNWVNITPLPGRWTDPGGPWGDDVSDLVRWGNSSPNLPVFVSLDKAPDAAWVEVGTIGIKPFDPKQDKQAIPPYYVGAVAVT